MAASDNQKELSEALKCSRCATFMLSSIYQCCKGHSVCGNCCDKFVRCRLCRCNVVKELRNYPLEEIISLMSFPCPFVNCNGSFKATELENHMKECKFKPLTRANPLKARRSSSKV